MIEIRCKKCNSKVCEIRGSLTGVVTFPCKKCNTWNIINLTKVNK